MSVLDIDHYNLRVPKENIDALCSFYTSVIGLTVGHRPLKSFGYWLYAGKKSLLHLSLVSVDEQREYDKQNAFDHIAFSCSDLTEFEARLTKSEVSYKRNVITETGQIQLFLHDPLGNKIELNFLSAMS
jgi:catechol-2,3-dioxygenase